MISCVLLSFSLKPINNNCKISLISLMWKDFKLKKGRRRNPSTTDRPRLTRQSGDEDRDRHFHTCARSLPGYLTRCCSSAPRQQAEMYGGVIRRAYVCSRLVQHRTAEQRHYLNKEMSGKFQQLSSSWTFLGLHLTDGKSLLSGHVNRLATDSHVTSHADRVTNIEQYSSLSIWKEELA